MIYGFDKIDILENRTGYEAPNGDWVDGDEVITYTLLCDAEPANGAANTITLPDGQSVSYAYTITLDVTCSEIPVGTNIILHCFGKQPQRMTCKGFHRYSTTCKLWV